MSEKCYGCKYWRPFDTKGYYACHYLLDTNKCRGCKAENCDKYTIDDAYRWKMQKAWNDRNLPDRKE